jgi:hypothetical protein
MMSILESGWPDLIVRNTTRKNGVDDVLWRTTSGSGLRLYFQTFLLCASSQQRTQEALEASFSSLCSC